MSSRKENLREEVQEKRLLRSLLVISGCLLVLAVSGFVGPAESVGEFGTDEPKTAGLAEYLSASGGLAGSDPSSAREAMLAATSLVDGFETGRPLWFERDFFELDDALRCYASSSEGVWGFVFEGSSSGRFAGLRHQMEQRGWSCVDSGLSNCATFVREEGDYRWALLSCSSVGEDTTAVLQIA